MRTPRVFCLLVAGLVCTATSATAQEATDEEKVRNALGAAPAEVADGATVLDWPAAEGEDFRVLREGDNGWTCLTSPPGSPNFEPMCNDGEWMDFLRAFVSGTAPEVEKVGLSYMLNAEWAVSNIDPAATEPTPDNQWHSGGAHLMVIVPDPAMLDGFPDRPDAGGAYVMWKGTPYVHLMIPLEPIELHASP